MSIPYKPNTNMKTTKFTRFPNQDENKGMFSSKSKLWNKKMKTKTWHVWSKNTITYFPLQPTKFHFFDPDNTRQIGVLMIFYYKEEIKIEQGYDPKKNPKLVLNILKIMWNYTSIYTY
jgi:hypothetical protein